MSYLETNKTVKSLKKSSIYPKYHFCTKIRNKKMFFTNIFFEISDANH